MFTVKCFNSSVIFIIKRGNKRNLWDCSTDNTNNTRNNNNQNDSSPVTFPLPYWPCWFWNVPGLLPLHCFLLPLLTLVHPGLLPIHPLRFFVHVALLFSLYCPPICDCTPQLMAFASLPLHFLVLHSTYHSLPNNAFYFVYYFPSQECKPHEDRDFYLFGRCCIPMTRQCLEYSRYSTKICWIRNE